MTVVFISIQYLSRKNHPAEYYTLIIISLLSLVLFVKHDRSGTECTTWRQKYYCLRVKIRKTCIQFVGSDCFVFLGYGPVSNIKGNVGPVS